MSDFNESHQVFSYLDSLKFLNLSFNSIEIVSSYLFSNLLKLETLDLSYNNIYLLEDYSFNNLNSLRNLHINENQMTLTINSKSFVELDSIQNIYLSKSILSNEIKLVFIDLFTIMNRNADIKNSLIYFKSLSLTATKVTVDCKLTLFFIRSNVHYNLKTDQDIFDFIASCARFVLKEVAPSENGIFLNRNRFIFTNFFLIIVWLVLTLIAILGLYLSRHLKIKKSTF